MKIYTLKKEDFEKFFSLIDKYFMNAESKSNTLMPVYIPPVLEKIKKHPRERDLTLNEEDWHELGQFINHNEVINIIGLQASVNLTLIADDFVVTPTIIAPISRSIPRNRSSLGLHVESEPKSSRTPSPNPSSNSNSGSPSPARTPSPAGVPGVTVEWKQDPRKIKY